MTTKLLQSLLIGALLSASTAFAGDSAEKTAQNGTQQAAFNLGDSKCVLVDDTIRCIPTLIASN